MLTYSVYCTKDEAKKAHSETQKLVGPPSTWFSNCIYAPKCTSVFEREK